MAVGCFAPEVAEAQGQRTLSLSSAYFSRIHRYYASSWNGPANSRTPFVPTNFTRKMRGWVTLPSRAGKRFMTSSRSALAFSPLQKQFYPGGLYGPYNPRSPHIPHNLEQYLLSNGGRRWLVNSYYRNGYGTSAVAGNWNGSGRMSGAPAAFQPWNQYALKGLDYNALNLAGNAVPNPLDPFGNPAKNFDAYNGMYGVFNPRNPHIPHNYNASMFSRDALATQYLQSLRYW